MKNFTSIGTIISMILAVGIILSVCKHCSYEIGTTFQPQKTIDSAIAGIR